MFAPWSHEEATQPLSKPHRLCWSHTASVKKAVFFAQFMYRTWHWYWSKPLSKTDYDCIFDCEHVQFLTLSAHAEGHRGLQRVIEGYSSHCASVSLSFSDFEACVSKYASIWTHANQILKTPEIECFNSGHCGPWPHPQLLIFCVC